MYYISMMLASHINLSQFIYLSKLLRIGRKTFFYLKIKEITVLYHSSIQVGYFFLNRAAEILYAITQTYSAHEESAYIDLIKARRNLALHQHHDGITGTSKNEVAIDFQNRMLSAIQTSIKIMESSIFFLMNKSKSSKEDKSITHEKARKGLKPIKRIFNVNNDSSVIIVYNPLAQERVQVVSIIISQPFVKVNSYLFIFTFMWKHLLRAALKKKLP